MSRCPFPHDLIKSLGKVSDGLYQHSNRVSESSVIERAQNTYSLMGDTISDIFPDDFFSLSFDASLFSDLAIEDARDLFIQQGEMQIMRYYSQKKKKGLEFVPLVGSKMYPTDPIEIIRLGWDHATSVIVLLLSSIIKRGVTKEEYDEYAHKALGIAMQMSRMHLTVETSVFSKLESILAEGTIPSHHIYGNMDKVDGFDLPKLGCPAVFFGDKRVGKALFYWIRDHLEQHYRALYLERKENEPLERVRKLGLALRTKIATLLK